jgi:hypothetical protein
VGILKAASKYEQALYKSNDVKFCFVIVVVYSLKQIYNVFLKGLQYSILVFFKEFNG